MTIKKRFLISYIGGIAIACVSLVSIMCIVFYITTEKVPSPGTVYKYFTQQRSLSPEEELTYIKLRGLAKSEPDQLLTPSGEVKEVMHAAEKEALGIVIRKQDKMMYYSEDLVEKSLIAHFPAFDVNNIATRGTIDNAGRLYRYMKFDFNFSDQTPGSLLILKKENTFLEFMTKWGILIILLILVIGVGALLFLTRLMERTIIFPLENLGQGIAEISQGNLEIAMEKPMVRTANEVKKLTNDFEIMRETLIRSMQEQEKLENNRKELVASISHDLKTPITSIIGYVEGLLDGVADSPEKQARYLQTIHKKAISLDEMIEELFLYSKLDAAVIPFHYEPIDSKEFLQHIVEEFQLQDDQVSIQFTSKLSDNSLILGDRTQLNRVFINLIENSIKFKEPERPLLIKIELTEEESYVVIRVIDNGQGITQEQLPFVFDHFYRGEQERSTKTGGSGLGLAIVKQIIDTLAGKITIESESHQGTIVSILLKKLEEA